jgi:hypothetical protein
MDEKELRYRVTIAGTVVVGHAVPSNILSGLLDQVQKLRIAAAEITSGSYSAKGKSSKKMLEISRLNDKNNEELVYIECILTIGGIKNNSFAIDSDAGFFKGHVSNK